MRMRVPGSAFFAAWRKKFGDEWISSNSLRQSAEVTWDPTGTKDDPWDGLFPTDARGRLLSVKSLGRVLTGRVNPYRGSYRLCSRMDSHDKVRHWRVEEWSG